MTVKFAATKINLSEKKGVLPVDEHGYYTMPVGGLNTFNSAGQYYTLNGAKKLFEDSSIFMRRVANGALRGELGHPKKSPDMSMRDYMNRILTIDESNICVHFSEIWLDLDFGKKFPQYKNPELVAIMAKLKPSGAHAAALQAALENPKENAAFSIRAFTVDYREGGVYKRCLDNIVTFDHVNEPGIAFANKYDAPALESLTEATVTTEMIDQLLEEQKDLGLENAQMLTQLKTRMASRVSELPAISIPKYLNW